jgi:eukaryotic-like serine/threonine-protein kinase
MVSPVTAGDVLDGRYLLLSPIGEGGVGVVWRARQITLDADVAIKLLHARTGAEEVQIGSRGQRLRKLT